MENNSSRKKEKIFWAPEPKVKPKESSLKKGEGYLPDPEDQIIGMGGEADLLREPNPDLQKRTRK